MSNRRPVRVTPAFFDALDQQLPTTRTAGSGVTSNEFAAYDLLEIVEVFALHWDSLPPMIAGRDTYRLWISTGRLVAFYSVVGQLAPDGAVELVDIDIDLHGPGDHDSAAQ